MNGYSYALACVISFLFGIIIGGVMITDSHMNDCNSLGKVRMGNNSYTCEVNK